MSMSKTLFATTIIFLTLLPPLFSQTDMEYALTRYKGNKIVLLGEWKPDDVGKWGDAIDSGGIFEHGFILLDRARIAERRLITVSISAERFERWFRQHYGLGGNVRWATLDSGNKLILAGTITPNSKEFEQMLDQRGIESPLRQLRDFLRENPDHQDAKTDMLREVRRRAIHVMPPGADEDLDDEADLRTWAVLAAETDRIFRGSWLGIDPVFFLPHKDQPEYFSKLMRAVFSRHISQVESAVRQYPLDESVWNIWAWMARGLRDYRWQAFIDSLEHFYFPLSNISSPPADVCVWLVSDAMANKDWDTVIKFGRQARGYAFDRSTRGKVEYWMPPGGWRIATYGAGDQIEGYPMKSAEKPYVYALLRTGNVEEANRFFDQMVIPNISGIGSYKASPSEYAAVARLVGMEDLAKQWELGQRMGSAPHYSLNVVSNYPRLYLNTSRNSDFFKKFSSVKDQVWPVLYTFVSGGPIDVDTLGWEVADGERWGLLGQDGRLLAQDTVIPDKDALQAIFRRNGIEDPIEYFRSYLASSGSVPGIELWAAFQLNSRHFFAYKNDQNPDPSSESQLSMEATRYLRSMLNSPDALFNLPSVGLGISGTSQLLKSLSKPYLAAIELLLERKPSSENVWSQWLYWRAIEEEERSILPLLERIKCSPLSQMMATIPMTVLDFYYEEARKAGDWPNVIELLMNVWAREFSRKNEPKEDRNILQPFDFAAEQNMTTLGDTVGIPLIEAYLQDGKASEAEEVFNAWLDSGGKFNNVSKIVKLAREKGQERLAREWEGKIGK